MSPKFFSQSSLLSGVRDGFNNQPKQAHTVSPVALPQTVQTKAPSIDIVKLGDDLHHLILTELLESCPSSLLALALVSRALNAITTPYIYRTVTLKRHNPFDRKSRARLGSINLLERLKSENENGVAKHVRHLRVEEFSSADDLEKILGRFTKPCCKLTIGRWNTSTTVPPDVLSMLETKWPDAKLVVRDHLRHNEKGQTWDLDENLLRSPQLDILDIDILTEGYGYGDKPCLSEWPQLSSLLRTGCRPRTLRIKIRAGYPVKIWRPRRRGPALYRDQDLPRLSLDQDTTLPPLKELSIIKVSGAGYYFDPAHSAMLAQSMDWSNLKKLDFGRDCPVSLFTQLIGRLPNLISLRFGFPNTEINCDAVYRFIDALNSLEKLEIYNVAVQSTDIWTAIKKHRDTLKTLILHPSRLAYQQTKYVELARLKDVVKYFKSLEHLGIEVPFEAQELSGDSKEMLNLRTLDLYIHLPSAATTFSADYQPDVYGRVQVPSLEADSVVTQLIAIADAISQAQQENKNKQKTLRKKGGRPLERLNVHFARTGYSDRYQPYRVEAELQLVRSVRDDAESLGDKKWNVDGKLAWSNPHW
ncbi:hypothetical protein BDV96DRAFT_488604 [Lophiotrema nucula]|uniref:Uncharacterized protein n=1 Tax=Lophiotrema nucula TaxID=690887 RepID=A0A6A5ZGV9_9PLEO|nr:hypothetical protein BDV96DRAFT_488604 [Lophiotrema nucula]